MKVKTNYVHLPCVTLKLEQIFLLATLPRAHGLIWLVVRTSQSGVYLVQSLLFGSGSRDAFRGKERREDPRTDNMLAFFWGQCFEILLS